MMEVICYSLFDGGRVLPMKKIKIGLCQIMAQNGSSWFQDDNSWRKTAAHGRPIG